MTWEARIKLFVAACMLMAIAFGAWFASSRRGQLPSAPGPNSIEPGAERSIADSPEPDATGMDAAVPPSREAARVNSATRSGERIAGFVFDSERRPIVGARVSAFDNKHGAVRVLSVADGSFEIGGLSSGPYQLSATKDHFNDAMIEDVRVGTTSVEFVLTAMSGVHGRVVDAVTGAPISSFELVALDSPPGGEDHWRHIVGSNQTDWRAIEDSDGAFAVEDVPSERITAVGVRADGYAITYTEIQPIAPAATAGPIEIALPAEAQLAGRVLDPDGNSVSGAEVFLGAKTGGIVLAHSDDTGFYTIDGLQSGSYQFTAAHTDYRPATIEISLSNGERRTADIRLGEGGAITGRVYHGDAPVPRQMVTISKLTVPRVEWTAVTDSEGRYDVEGLPPGSLDVIATLSPEVTGLEEPMQLQLSAVVETGATTTVDFHFVENLSRIAGVISIEGAPPVEAVVQGTIITGAGDSSLRTRTDEQGQYLVDRVPPGDGWLDITAKGQDGVERKRRVEITVDEGENLTVDVDFAGGANIFGTVRGWSGEHAGEVSVFPGELSFETIDAQRFLALARSQVASSPIDANGSYRVEGIQSGTYTVAVFVFNVNADTGDEALANVLTDWRTVQVSGGEDVTVDLSLAPR